MIFFLQVETSQFQKGELMLKNTLKNIIKFLVCLALMSAFIGCTSTHKRESTGQYVDDSVITAKVKTAIFKEETLKALQINVKTFKGVVQLSGFVDSSQAASKAGEVAKNVDNVVSVKNDLIVK